MPADSFNRPRTTAIRLRPTVRADIPALFEIQLDPAANALAGTKPRDRAAFEARWDEILAQPQDPSVRVTPRVIVACGALVGSINIFPQEDTDSIGYWIDREYWGRGIATRAIALMLEEFRPRPLFARVSAHNTASARALERNGFVLIERRHSPATERYIEGETLVFTLTGAFD